MADYNSAYTGVQIDENLALAATATQPGDLGTAAFTASTAYATAAQGALADTAVQPADDAADLGSGAATDGYVLTADGAGGAAWEAGGGGSSVTDYLRTRLGTVQDVFNMADTWNAIGTTFTGIKLNVTDTASAAGSLLMDLQIGGASRFSIGKGTQTTGYVIKSNTVGEIVNNNAQGISMTWGATILLLDSVGVKIGTFAAYLNSDAANTLAQRNGVNPQAFNLYNTYTDASNYERGFMSWASNILRIGTGKLGTGAARAMEFQTDGTTRLTIGTAGAINTSGTLSVGTYLAVPGGTLNGNSGVYFGVAGSLRAQMQATADGRIAVSNWAGTDFDRLQFGGTTSSFPAIKHSTTSLQARLADDSAFTNIQGKLTTDTAYTAGAPAATGYIVLFDSAGTAYKVPAEAL